MAEFIVVDKNKYRVVGTYTEEDINKINSFRNRTTLILDNTVGLSSELISKIVSDRVVFSIKGGLDYDTKEKYKAEKYVNRTFVSLDGLKKIIKYFEYNESLIDPRWNDFEKAMFLYNAIVVDMEYASNYEENSLSGIIERSLNGILYGKLVCAGFAQVYKEMLDRIGIKNYYQNQRSVHAFNIIEVDNKKYGVDVTWDNNDKKNNNGRCCFRFFGHDLDFYNKNGHKLYEELGMDDFNLGIVYDKDEEIYDLSVLSINQLKEYYSHIASSINNRKPFRYNLQKQSLEIKNKYLPVDIAFLRLKEEAIQEYPVVWIMDFLKKRNVLQINSNLIEYLSSRKGYLLDIVGSSEEYKYSLDLSLFGIDNYEIDKCGNVIFNNGNEKRYDIIWGIDIGNSNMSQEELDTLYSHLNRYLNDYLDKYILNIIENLDVLLSNYEYKPDEWDFDRALENGNIYSKLAIIINGRDYLIQSGMSEQEIDSIIQRIINKDNEVHNPYENTISKKDSDLDFLSVIIDDFDMIWQTIEYDLKKQITEEEFISLYSDVDYMIQLLERYIIIAEDEKFKFDEYDVSKEDLQQLLRETINSYQNKKIVK